MPASILAFLLACTSTHEPASPENPPDAPAKDAPATDPVQPDVPADAAPDTWSTGIVEVTRATAPATVTGVRTGRHDGFDRVVFDLSGPVPGWKLEYIDKPVRQCGSGDTVDVRGDGWLEIRLAPAYAHDDKGQPTTAAETLPGLTNLQELQRTCDFEAVTAFVAGVGSPNAYRVFELSDPARIVVDIKHSVTK